jgi:cellulose synthase/poly-beta-1,6-N-acetylglucosamine synthase-like glycosyltransferase
LLGSLQETEYLRTFPIGSTYQGKQRLSVILSAFGAFRKQNVIAIGGFPPGGNETDMVVRLSKSVTKDNKDTHSIELPPNPVLDTEPLRSVGTLVRQRMEWESAMFFTLRSNINMLFNPKYGKTGMFDIPYMWLFKIIGPIIECLGIITIPVSFALGFIGLEILILFFAIEFIFGTLVSMSAIASQQILDNERPSLKRLLRQVLSAIVNNFGYRQVLLFFSVAGLFMKRKGSHKTD